MLTLHILRHAKTNPLSDSGKDFDRNLLEKGVNQAKSLGGYFKINNFQANKLYCSSALRTRKTISEVNKIHVFDNKIAYREELYLASLENLLDFIWIQEGEGSVFIIGHNEGVSDLVTYLTGTHVEIKTGTFVSISFDLNSWGKISASNGKVEDYFSPK